MTSPNELEGAVERVKAVAGLPHTTPVRASVLVCQEDLRTILDALASITRERDEARASAKEQFEVATHNAKACSELREQNGRLSEAVNGYRQVAAQDKHRAETAEAERDAMREAHRPYAAVSAKAKGKDDDCWCGQDGAVIRYRDLRLSAALVNGEASDAS